jgi:uncharacterized protein
MAQDFSWQDVEKLVKNITDQIETSNWRPTVVIALSRGGFVPATMIAYDLGIKTMAGLPVAKNEKGVRSLSPLFEPTDLSEQKVLVVDDGIIGGHLMPLAVEKVRKHGGEVRTCALVSLGRCPDPDYLADIHSDMPNFPWE